MAPLQPPQSMLAQGAPLEAAAGPPFPEPKFRKVTRASAANIDDGGVLRGAARGVPGRGPGKGVWHPCMRVLHDCTCEFSAVNRSMLFLAASRKFDIATEAQQRVGPAFRPAEPGVLAHQIQAD